MKNSLDGILSFIIHTLGWVSVYIVVGIVVCIIAFHFFRLFKSRKKILISSLALFCVIVILSIRHFVYYYNGTEYESFVSFQQAVAGFCYGMILFLGITFVIQDIVLFVLFLVRKIRKIKKNDSHKVLNYFNCGVFLLCLSVILTLFSFISPNFLVDTNYKIELKKKASTLNNLKIVLLSDFHMGVSIKEQELIETVNLTNKKNPDVIFLGGDIFDEGTPNDLKQVTIDRLNNLRARYGVYYIIGNHDSVEEIKLLRGSNIIPLVDSVKTIVGKFNVVGLSDEEFSPLNVSDVVSKIKPKYMNLPCIVIKHRPSTNETSKQPSLDLQLSGHTHNGQLLPFSFIDFFHNMNVYGEYDYNKLKLIVSSGVGTYGVPLRLFTKSEIVTIDVRFR